MKIDRNAEAERIHAIETSFEVHEAENPGSKATAQPKGPLVRLSTEAQKVQRLRDAVDSTPAIREERVANLRKLYQAGKLQIDSGRLADVMEVVLRHV